MQANPTPEAPRLHRAEHLKMISCPLYQCRYALVGNTPLPDDEHEDALRFRWLAAHATEWPCTSVFEHCLSLAVAPLSVFRQHAVAEFRHLIDSAIEAQKDEQ